MHCLLCGFEFGGIAQETLEACQQSFGFHSDRGFSSGMAEVPFILAGTMCSAGVQSRICRSAYANASHTEQCTGRPQILVHVDDRNVTHA